MRPRIHNTITEVTRQAIFDYLSIGPHWSGAQAEDAFLGRLYDLKAMTSNDHRHEYNNAAKDIHQHRVRNLDWPDDWVFTDERFDLMYGPDENLLRFLAHTVSPLVRPDASESESMVRQYNLSLNVDGWEIYCEKVISEKPVYGFRQLADSARPHLDEAGKIAEQLSGPHIGQQVRRLRDAVERDPDLAIGTAKEFVETLCKAILAERNQVVPRDIEFPALVRKTIGAVEIVRPGTANAAEVEKLFAPLIGNLSAIGHKLAEIRNQYGTGHGRNVGHTSLGRRHAKLVVGAATTLAVFLYECHEAGMRGNATEP